MAKTLRRYGEISRIDEEERMVWGYASTYQKATDGLMVTRSALEGALDGYMEYANIREMHQPSAVGRADEAYVDDTGLYIGAKIVDDDAWTKVKERVYRAFSIEGPIIERDSVDRSVVTALEIREISLVDRGADPGAKFDLWRAEGADAYAEDDDEDQLETPDMARANQAAEGDKPAEAAPEDVERAEAPAEAVVETPEAEAEAPAEEPVERAEGAAAEAEAAEAPEAAAEAAQEAQDGDPVVRAVEAANAAASAAQAAVEGLARAVEGEPEPVAIALPACIAEGRELHRSLYSVGRLADCLQTLAYIIYDADFEKEAEGDASGVPDQLRAGLKVLAEAYRSMAEEELSEFLANMKVERAAGAETDQDQLQRAAGLQDELERLQGENTALKAGQDTLLRSLEGVTSTVTGLQETVERLSKLAVPAKTVGAHARAVSKEEDAAGAGAAQIERRAEAPSEEDVQRMLDAMSEEERGLLLIRASQTRPIALTR